MRKACILLLLILSYLSSFSQNNRNDDIKVFIDCNAWCDFDFIRTEINYVNFVRDRFSANIYVMLTSQQTGSGGSELKLYFSGQEQYKGLDDTLQFNRSSVSTEDEYRKQLVQFLKLGLTRYIAKSSLAEKLSIQANIEKGVAPLNATTQKKDPWNSWVFNTRANLHLNGSDNYSSSTLQFRLSAARVTEKLKFNVNANYNNEKNKFIYNDYDTITGEIIFSDTTKSTIQRSNLNSMVGLSLGNHWSVGAFARFYTSSFSNIKNSVSFKPAIEYSIFPYKISTTKYLGFLYMIGPVLNKYETTTWRDKNKEWLLQQNLSFDMNFTQKWGSINGSLYWSNYFFNWNWNNYGFFGNASVRIVKGLNFNFFGGFSIIHDQVELPKGNATQTQVLIRQRILKNTFDYFTGFGIGYRFGSIYNNVVNPRMGEGRSF